MRWKPSGRTWVRKRRTGRSAMETAEHRESYESRGSRTDLGAPRGESPLGDSTTGSILYRAEIGSSGWIADLSQPRGEQAPISDLPSRLHPRTARFDPQRL